MEPLSGNRNAKPQPREYVKPADNTDTRIQVPFKEVNSCEREAYPSEGEIKDCTSLQRKCEMPTDSEMDMARGSLGWFVLFFFFRGSQ